MIKITRFDGSHAYINPHLLEFIEKNPDTTLVYNGKKIVVKDEAEEILSRIIVYRRSIGIAISDVEGHVHDKD